jgi:hypothetical protein
MFTWLNKQGVRSDRGFEVQFTGRFDAEYREDHRVVSLSVESGMSGGLPCISIDPNSFLQWDDGVEIPADRQAQMLENLRLAMEFQGLQLVVEEGKSSPR